MKRFWSSLWMCATAQGGVDIQFLGDSTTMGLGVGVTQETQNWPSLLGVDLQAALNPAGVPGGYGSVLLDNSTVASTGTPSRATAGSATWDLLGKYNVPTTGGGKGLALIHAGSDTDRYILVDFKGTNATDPVQKKQAATHLRLLGAGGGNGFAPRVDIYTKPGNTTPVTIGTGAYGTSNGVLTSSAEAWDKATAAVTVNAGVSPTTDWRVQVYNGSGQEVYLSHFILFNGDKDCGIRVHNMGFSGSTAAEWAAATDTQKAQAFFASAAASGTGATAGNNSRLVVLQLGLNDFVTRTASQLAADVGTIVTWAEGLTSRPAVLIIAPLPRYDGAYASCYKTWEQYIDGLHSIAQAHPRTCAVLDLWKMLNYGRPDTGLPNTLGILNTGDQVHFSVYGYYWVKEAVKAVCLMDVLGLQP